MSQRPDQSDSERAAPEPRQSGPSHTAPPKTDPKAVHESKHETVSEPGGFKNDPDDPTSPNEAIERSRRQLRPTKN